MLQIQRQNNTEVVIRNISLSVNVNLRDLCVDRLWRIKRVYILDEYSIISRRWLIKFSPRYIHPLSPHSLSSLIKQIA